MYVGIIVVMCIHSILFLIISFSDWNHAQLYYSCTRKWIRVANWYQYHCSLQGYQPHAAVMVVDATSMIFRRNFITIVKAHPAEMIFITTNNIGHAIYYTAYILQYSCCQISWQKLFATSKHVTTFAKACSTQMIFIGYAILLSALAPRILHYSASLLSGSRVG
jgi:hypothetical protein